MTDTATRVLVVDDDDQVRGVIRRLLQREGYHVDEAAGVDAGLELLASEGEVALVISDLHMPDRDGVAFLRELRVRYPDTGVVMLTGDDDVTAAVECLRIGAADYLSKPIDLHVVRARLAKALTERQRMLEVRRLRENYQEDLKRQVGELSRKNAAMFIAQVQMAVTMLEARDAYTRGHSQRVAEYAGAVGHQLNLDGDGLSELRLGGELHDIGKIGTRDAVLWKPGPLTGEEFAEIRQHTIDGEAMLSALREDHPAVLQIVRSHHERLDGSGFPDGLRGDAIPLPARIVCVVDAFDAMISTRTYRKAQPVGHALGELRRGAGHQFDPAVVSAFLTAYPEGPLERIGPPD